MEPIDAARFGELVDDALDGIPDALWERLDNVAVVVEDANAEEADLLGLYEGVPLTERYDYSGFLPDHIAIYRLPLCEMCHDEAELIEQIRITVVHEIAHHVGIEEAQLHELGWG